MDLKETLVLIQKYYNGEDIEFNTLDIVADLYDLETPDGHDLASLIEHEPAEGGIFGLSPAKMKAYRQEILDTTNKMLNDLCNGKINKLETINLVDFVDYCLTDSTIFFDFNFDEEANNLVIRITNDIGAYCVDENWIELKKDIQRDRTFQISRVEKFSIDKEPELVCDSILDVGYEKNQIWFTLGDSETLRLYTKEGFEVSTLSLATFKKEIAEKGLVNKTRHNLLGIYLLMCGPWFITCLFFWSFIGFEKAKTLFFSGCVFFSFVAVYVCLGRKIKELKNQNVK